MSSSMHAQATSTKINSENKSKMRNRLTDDKLQLLPHTCPRPSYSSTSLASSPFSASPSTISTSSSIFTFPFAQHELSVDASSQPRNCKSCYRLSGPELEVLRRAPGHPLPSDFVSRVLVSTLPPLKHCLGSYGDEKASKSIIKLALGVNPNFSCNATVYEVLWTSQALWLLIYGELTLCSHVHVLTCSALSYQLWWDELLGGGSAQKIL
jgi:hypothetical protein